jgi:NAD(P)-dependent dehydrogenase (short-subunit alcohol dehydrogenase family)
MKEKELSSNKLVFISGAAGGLGKVLVREYSAIGYRVIAADIESTGLSEFSSSENVFTIKLDVTDLEQVKSLVKEQEIDRKGLDVLVCLAGIYDTYPVTEADPDLFKNIMAVNLLGTASLVQCFLKPLIRNKGRVIVVSSESYRIQAMFQPYMISKAALEAFCRTARQELALKGVKLVVMRPGAIRTPLLNWMSAPVDPGKYPVFDQELKISWKMSIKMVGTITSPEKVAGKILRASTVSVPKRIYRINNSPVLTLFSFLPAGIIDRLIIRMFRLKVK